jgi:hypothetical protein
VPRIAITGTRSQSAGRTVITISGTSNLPAGTTMHPWSKHPGGNAFTEGSAEIVVDDSGDFTWSRRSSRAITLYVRTLDGSVTSNRITIR